MPPASNPFPAQVAMVFGGGELAEIRPEGLRRAGVCQIVNQERKFYLLRLGHLLNASQYFALDLDLVFHINVTII